MSMKIFIFDIEVSMNNFFRLLASVRMDSRLRGNDTEVPCDSVVIPAQAGIHADTPRKFKESIHTYLINTLRFLMSSF